MSATPIVASADDVPAAIQYAQSKIHSRWYVARRAQALGLAELVPAEWGDVLTAAFGGDWSPPSRDKAAGKGEAMPDGSFPIADVADLKRAISAYGRAKDKDAAKRWIIKRARKLKAVDQLPEDWGITASAGPDDDDLEPVVAAGWDANVHPRDKDGKFIEVGALLRLFSGHPNAFEGTAIGNEDGRIQVQVTKPAKGSVGARVGDTISVDPANVEVAPARKANLPAADVPTMAHLPTDEGSHATGDHPPFQSKPTAENPPFQTPSGDGYSGAISRADGTPVTDPAELATAAQALGVTHTGSDGLSPLFGLDPQDESQLKLDGFLTKDSGGYHLDVDAGELSADNAPDTSYDPADPSNPAPDTVDGQPYVPEGALPTDTSGNPTADVPSFEVPVGDRMDMTRDVAQLDDLAESIRDDNPDGADQLQERVTQLQNAISGGRSDEIVRAYENVASDLSGMTDPDPDPNDPTSSDVEDAAGLFDERAKALARDYSDPSLFPQETAPAPRNYGDLSQGIDGESTVGPDNPTANLSIGVEDALVRAQGMEPPADYSGDDWEGDLQGIEDSLAHGHLDDAEAAAWTMGLDNLAQQIQNEAASGGDVRAPEQAAQDAEHAADQSFVNQGSEFQPSDFQHVTYDPNSGTTLDVRPNLEDYTSPDWLSSNYQFDTLDSMLADGVDPTDEYAAGDYNSRDMQALQDLTNTAEALDVDPSDYLNTVREIHNLGSAQQEQLQAIADGAPLEDQNSNALRNIADVLESSGVDDFREAAAGIREYLDAASSGSLPDYHANNEERANAADEVLKANGASRVWSAAADAFPGDEGGAVKYAEDVAGLLTEAGNTDLPDDAKQALKDWVVRASIDDPKRVGNGLVSKAYLQHVAQAHAEAGPFTASNPDEAKAAARADQFNADGSTRFEPSMVSDPRDANFGRHSVKRINGKNTDTSHHGLFPDAASAKANADERNRLTETLNGRTADISGASDDDLRAEYSALKGKLGDTPVYGDGNPNEGEDPVRLRGIQSELHRRGINPDAPAPLTPTSYDVAGRPNPANLNDGALQNNLDNYFALSQAGALSAADRDYYDALKNENRLRGGTGADATPGPRQGEVAPAGGLRPLGPEATKSRDSLINSINNKDGHDLAESAADDIFQNPDREAAHKQLAAVSTALRLGGKQRKAHREALDRHHGVDPASSGSDATAAQATADSLSPDNPLKDRITERAQAMSQPIQSTDRFAPEGANRPSQPIQPTDRFAGGDATPSGPSPNVSHPGLPAGNTRALKKQKSEPVSNSQLSNFTSGFGTDAKDATEILDAQGNSLGKVQRGWSQERVMDGKVQLGHQKTRTGWLAFGPDGKLLTPTTGYPDHDSNSAVGRLTDAARKRETNAPRPEPHNPGAVKSEHLGLPPRTPAATGRGGLGMPDSDPDAASLENENYHTELQVAHDNPDDAGIQKGARKLAQAIKGGKPMPPAYEAALRRNLGVGPGETYSPHGHDAEVADALREFGGGAKPGSATTQGTFTSHQARAFNDAFGNDPSARMRGKGKAEFDDPKAALAKLNAHIAGRRGAPDKNVAHHSLRRKLEAIQPSADSPKPGEDASGGQSVDPKVGPLGTPVGDLTDAHLDFQLAGLLRKQRSGVLPPDMKQRVVELQNERMRRYIARQSAAPSGGGVTDAERAATVSKAVQEGSGVKPARTAEQAIAGLNERLNEQGGHYTAQDLFQTRLDDVQAQLADPEFNNITVKPPSGFEIGLSKDDARAILKSMGIVPRG